MTTLTKRQEEILCFIENYEWRNRFWPSIRDIQQQFAFKSTNAVIGHLRALERKEQIERIPGQARSYRVRREGVSQNSLPDSAMEVVDVPVYGDIAAGYPDRVESSGEIGRLQVDIQTAGRLARHQNFALQVRGESMVEAGIHDGDTVIVEPREPRDGDIVAALIDGETTLKRFVSKPGEYAYLKAENASFGELHPVADLTIQGVAKAIVRNL